MNACGRAWCTANHSEKEVPLSDDLHFRDEKVTVGDATLEFVLEAEHGRPKLLWTPGFIEYSIEPDEPENSIRNLSSALTQMADRFDEFAREHTATLRRDPGVTLTLADRDV